MTEQQTDNTFQLKNGRSLGYAEFGDKNGVPVLYFHGLPSSRLEAGIWHRNAVELKVRLIAPDRPGLGLSTADEARKLLDYPNDIIELLQYLDIRSARIIGISGGGPYALACAANSDLAPMVESVAVVAGLVSQDLTRVGMGLVQRFAYMAINVLPGSTIGWFWDQVIGRKARNPDREVLRRAMRESYDAQGEEDRKLADEEVVDAMTEALRGAFLQGSQGYVTDATIVSGAWGFQLESITSVSVSLWYGGKDTLAPPRAGELMAKKIPGAIWKCSDGDSHTGIVLKHQEEILTLLCRNL